MGARAGADSDRAVACFRFDDEDRRCVRVRLACRMLGDPDFEHDPAGGCWRLSVPWPDADRFEYKFELTRPDGAREWICDPANPLRVPGGYGDSSVLLAPTYREPAWLHAPLAPGGWHELPLRAPALRWSPVVRVWSPHVPASRLLIAHDGPDYDRFADLGRYAAATVASGRAQPFHLALLPAGERDEWYSAAPAYARALVRELLPQLTARLGAGERVVGVGASLGALAMLHAQRRYPAAFAGLFLQSGSFFRPRYDDMESGFARYPRIVRFVASVLHGIATRTVPVAMTCGMVEENLRNNRDMADALRVQGYPTIFAENRDAHTWIGWRDALDPHLTTLLQRVWPH